MVIDDRWYTRPPGVPAHDAAGGVVVRASGSGLEVLLVREGTAPSFVLPKGHVEPGETEEEAARWLPLDALPDLFWPEQRDLLEQERGRIRTLAAKAAVRTQFSRQAARYARSDSHAADRDLDLLVDRLEVRPGDRILDIATGTGFTAFALAARGARVVGLDLTSAMLDQARRLSAAPGIAWVAGDAEALPFADGAFDAVTVRRAPHHFPHLRQALVEMRRVARPGGRVGIVDQVPPEEEAGRALMERLEKLRDPSHVEALTASRWRGLVEELGIEVTFLTVVERAFTFEAWLDLGGADDARRSAVEAALAAAPPDARRQIGDDGGGPVTFKKRWIVLVGRTPRDGAPA